MSVIKVSAKLDRTDSQTPWGFRMTGGKDYNSPLVIQKINPGSLSSKCGIKESDVITHIGGFEAAHLNHREAQGLIIGSGNNLELKLERSSGSSHNSSNDGYFQQLPSSLPWQQPQQQSYRPAPGLYSLAPKPFQKSGAVTTITSHVANLNVRNTSSPIQDDKSDDSSSHQTSTPLVVRQSSLNNKPQISAKPKLVPPPRPKPFASSNRSSSPASEPSQSNLSGSSPLVKPCLQPDSPPIKIIPPTRPKPSIKQFNSPIGLYSKQAQTEVELSKSSDPSNPPQLSIKEAPSGDDIVLTTPTQRKTITIQNNKNRVKSPSSHVSSETTETVVVQSSERKQIIVKSKSVNMSSTPPILNSSEIDLNGNKTISVSCAPIGPGDVIYGSEKAKIILKKRESSNEKPLMDFTLEDLGLNDAVVVGISLPDHMKECPPFSGPEVTESRSQIQIVTKPAHSHQGYGSPVQHHYGSPAQHHPSGPRSPTPSGGIVWRPHIPIGDRKMKIGRPGQAQRKPPMSGSARIPICTSCHTSIRGPYVTALDKTWCPDHFVCANPNCSQPLFDCGFVEEADQLYCEKDYEKYLAPRCARCSGAIVGEVVQALGLTLHPDCLVCHRCENPIPKFLYRFHSGGFYCFRDWGLMFQTKCYGCQFPIESGDRWVEALSQNWHSECFNCYTCQINLEGQSFCAKNGKPYCKKHGATRRF